MKSLLVLTVLNLLSVNAFSKTTEYKPFVGTYKLNKTLSGECAPTLSIVEEDFGNQRAEHSLSFYGHEGTPATSNIYQLTNLNSGIDYHLTTNTMFGYVDGTWYNVETLTDNHISAETKVRNVFGAMIWRTSFEAELNADSLYYTRTEYNTLTGIKVPKSDSCIYIK